MNPEDLNKIPPNELDEEFIKKQKDLASDLDEILAYASSFESKAREGSKTAKYFRKPNNCQFVDDIFQYIGSEYDGIKLSKQKNSDGICKIKFDWSNSVTGYGNHLRNISDKAKNNM